MKILMALLTSVFMGCSSDSSGGGGGDFSPFAGVWLERGDANELRTTGRLDSLCDDLKKDKDLKIVNMRLVEGNGGLHMYIPEQVSVKSSKIGILEDTGAFIPSASYKEGFNGTVMTASIPNDELVLHYSSKHASYAIDFLRSSIDEAKAYYAAQEACRD